MIPNRADFAPVDASRQAFLRTLSDVLEQSHFDRTDLEAEIEATRSAMQSIVDLHAGRDEG